MKNLVLAGVQASLCDGRPLEAMADTPTSFLDPTLFSAKENDIENKRKRSKGQTVAQAMKPHIEELNPLLGDCVIENSLVEDLRDDFFAAYDIVIASRVGIAQATRISQAVTSKGGKFYLVDCFGWYGGAIMDLGSQHLYKKELGKDKLSDYQKMDTYVSFDDIIKMKLSESTNRFHKSCPPDVWMRYRCILQYHAETNMWPSADKQDHFCNTITQWVIEQENKDTKTAETILKQDCLQSSELKQLATMATAQVSPVCAVLGGVIGNEVIKVISGKAEPANNTLLFDGFTGACQTFLIGNKFKGNNSKAQ
eukprot:CAMPEP_0195302652 /NCGR_PEP_ID=MMETSP0707-20130614/31448_1 /TAXON_ID=33640 /ORGANISM="Asterionellopsis glacialis, Strain CCMP134" /LENGTH=309 /DNA_ID=CAMNT_0040365963 /DNA_START=111 /DNA_END=1040 /DNA_ORIENTATION=+